MKLPKRFTLSTLLLVMLLVSLVFGYAQWRRQWLIAEIDRLKSEGVEMAGLSSNWFWPRVEGRAAITFVSEGPATYSYRGTAFTVEQAKERCRNLTNQIREVGVTQIYYCVTYSDSNGNGMISTKQLDLLEHYTRQLRESQ